MLFSRVSRYARVEYLHQLVTFFVVHVDFAVQDESDNSIGCESQNQTAHTVELSDSAKYLSFCVLNNLIHAILSDSMSDSSSEKEKEVHYLMFNSVSAAKSYTDQIYPLSYRLEILENSFSLLFVRSSHVVSLDAQPTFAEHNSESEIVEKKKDSRPHSRRSVNRDSPSIDENGRRISGSRKESTSMKSDSSGLECGVSRLSVGQLSNITSVDNDSVNNRATSHGFVACAEVVRTILSMLEDSIGVLIEKLNEPLSAENKFRLCKQRESVSAREELQHRASVLRQHVADARWRLRIVSPINPNHVQQTTEVSESVPRDGLSG